MNDHHQIACKSGLQSQLLSSFTLPHDTQTVLFLIHLQLKLFKVCFGTTSCCQSHTRRVYKIHTMPRCFISLEFAIDKMKGVGPWQKNTVPIPRPSFPKTEKKAPSASQPLNAQPSTFLFLSQNKAFSLRPHYAIKMRACSCDSAISSSCCLNNAV